MSRIIRAALSAALLCIWLPFVTAAPAQAIEWPFYCTFESKSLLVGEGTIEYNQRLMVKGPVTTVQSINIVNKDGCPERLATAQKAYQYYEFRSSNRSICWTGTAKSTKTVRLRLYKPLYRIQYKWITTARNNSCVPKNHQMRIGGKTVSMAITAIEIRFAFR